MRLRPASAIRSLALSASAFAVLGLGFTGTAGAAASAFTVQEGVTYTGLVGTHTIPGQHSCIDIFGNCFTNYLCPPVAALAPPSITWGDGTPSTPGSWQFTGGGSFDPSCRYTVLGSHKYTRAGSYAFSLSGSATGTGTATVTNRPLTAESRPFSATQRATATGVVATLVDENTSSAATDFTASVGWGDGTTSAGTVAAGATAGDYTVSGSHTYSSFGSFTVTVTITDLGAPATPKVIYGTANVAAAPPGPVVAGASATPDTTPPTIAKIMASPVVKFAALIKSGYTNRVTGLGAGDKVKEQLQLPAKIARPIGLRAGKAPVTIGAGAGVANAAGTATVKVKLTKRAGAALKRSKGKAVKATLVITATDAAGNRAVTRRPVSIKLR